MRRCIIHIGLHKTGTTAIQRTLAAKRDDLASAGILCPGDDKRLRVHHQVAFQVIGSRKLRDPEAATELLATSLIRHDYDYLVFSSEAFSRPNIPADLLTSFLQRIMAADWEIVVIAYIRPQPSMLNSMYVQAVKALREPGGFDDYAKGPREQMLDYEERLRPWTEQPGIKFVAVPYLPETTGPQIARHMLVAGGVAPDKLAEVDLTASPGINESIPLLAVAANRWLQRRDTSLRQDISGLRAEFRKLGVYHGGRLTRLVLAEIERRAWSADRFVAIDAPRVSRLREEYEARNGVFAARHFGRPWGDVFKSDLERDWRRNEIDIEALTPELQREFDEYAECMIAAVVEMRRVAAAKAEGLQRKLARAAAAEGETEHSERARAEAAEKQSGDEDDYDEDD